MRSKTREPMQWWVRTLQNKQKRSRRKSTGALVCGHLISTRRGSDSSPADGSWLFHEIPSRVPVLDVLCYTFRPLTPVFSRSGCPHSREQDLRKSRWTSSVGKLSIHIGKLSQVLFAPMHTWWFPLLLVWSAIEKEHYVGEALRIQWKRRDMNQMMKKNCVNGWERKSKWATLTFYEWPFFL